MNRLPRKLKKKAKKYGGMYAVWTLLSESYGIVSSEFVRVEWFPKAGIFVNAEEYKKKLFNQ